MAQVVIGKDEESGPQDAAAGTEQDQAPSTGKQAGEKSASAADEKKKAKKKRATKKKTAADKGAKKKTTKTAKKRAAKTSKSRRTKKGVPALPPKSLVLTNAAGELAGVLPKDALILIKRGIVSDPMGAAVGVDPRPTQRAFLWLLGYRLGQELDPAAPHQRQALRVIEQLVRASVIGDAASQELIMRLYAELFGSAPSADSSDRPETPPLSCSDLSLATQGNEPADE